MIEIPAMLLGRKGALSVVALAAAAFLVLVALPVLAAFEAQSEERDAALDEFATFRTEVASGPAMQRALAAVRIQASAVPGLMRSATPALAAAQLQTEIKQLVEANAGDLRSAQAISPTREKGFDRVAIQCDLTVPVAHLKDLLYAVEVHAPYFFIDHAEISAPMPQADNTQSGEQMLEVRWTVHAYRWAEPA
jgi:general secretion pathway protein M